MFPAYGYTKHSYPQGRPHHLHQGIPPQMKMEASNSPFMYETWPHHYGYPVPTQCHSCCNHNPYPSYYPYRPPYPLDSQFYGGYPVYPQPCSFHYPPPPPPPHYTMELPKYEYDKSHCCGCSHFKPDMSGDKGVKIVEQGSDAKKEEDSLVSSGFKNLPQQQPIVWIPSDDMKNQEHPTASKQDLKGVGQEPKLWSGLMPLDMDNLKRLLHNGNFRKDDDNQPRNPVHHPMIWLPYNNEEKGQMSTASESSKKTPFRTEQGDDHTQKLNPAVATEGEKPPRIIPVKQMDETADMKTKNIEFEGDKKSTEKGTKIKPSSPMRLPPICLRVDPLPKRKNGQGKSRSVSPPGDKVKPVEVVKPSSSVAEKDVVEVADGAEVDKLKSQEAEEKKLEEAIKPEKKILSGNEAATIIQSAYRGYEVRRWEPLKKMRQIANIREEAAALKRRIESSANSMDLKQKIALGETIMNMLLKLDTVQGLHSSIRDIRKSVAKELVSLQELLDTIVIKQPDVSSQGPDINQAEAKAKADANESSLSSSAQEPCIGPELENSGPKGIGEEVGELLSDSFTEQNESDIVEEAAIKNVAEEASVKPVDQEPSPAVADTNNDLLYELPVDAVMEEDLPPASETHVIEPDKWQGSDEASKGEVTIEQDVVSATPDKVETPFEIDESSLSSSLSKAEDQGALVMEENTKDQISSLHEPSDVVEQTAIKNVAEDIKPVDQEPSPGVADTNLDLLDELAAAAEEDVPKTCISFTPEKSQQMNVESETPATEPNKLQGSDEASKGEVTIEQDVVTSTPHKVETPFEIDDQAKVMINTYNEEEHNDETRKGDIEDVDNNRFVESEVVDIEVAKLAEEEVKLAIPSTENTIPSTENIVKEENEKMRDMLEKLIASGKEQQQVICSLNEKLRELEDKLAKQKKKKKRGSRTRKARVLMNGSSKGLAS